MDEMHTAMESEEATGYELMWDKLAEIRKKQQTHLAQIDNLKNFFAELKKSLDVYRQQVTSHLLNAELDRSYLPTVQTGVTLHLNQIEGFGQ